MRAAIYEEFGGPLSVQWVDDPVPPDQGVILQVRATGVCRSDWHGWQGHDPDITLPHVPGHEIAGTVAALGKETRNWREGSRVTLPFVCGCGDCPQCASGNHQVCDRQSQPGFTHWGSYAQYVAVDYADINLVALPEELDFVTAASLGCRFATSFRAVVAQGKISDGQWLAVYGCGGVGLAAIMIGNAFGANVVAIDIDEDKLRFAESLGASAVVNASKERSVVAAVRELTSGGAHVSIDALGSGQTSFDSIAGLRKRGKHLQVGLMVGDDRHSAVPMDQVVANELQILGSHGMQAHEYDRMLRMIADGTLEPAKLVGNTVTLQQAARDFVRPESSATAGVTVINDFRE